MTEKSAWRVFQSMQDSVLTVGTLVYAMAALDAWQVLPGGADLKLRLTALFPGAFLLATLAAVLAVAPLRRAISRHLLISYRTGFGQTVISVVGGLGLLVAVAGLMVWQAHHLAHGGTSPAGAFAGYGAGLGLLIAQAILVRRLAPDADPG